MTGTDRPVATQIAEYISRRFEDGADALTIMEEVCTREFPNALKADLRRACEMLVELDEADMLMGDLDAALRAIRQ